MRHVGSLTAEAMRVAASQPVATTVTALIVAATCGVIVATTGQTVALERDVLGRIDDAGTRTIVVEDVDGAAGLSSRAVSRIEALDGVSWAIGFSPARDMRPAGLPGGVAVPARGYFGELPAIVATSGADLESGTAFAGLGALEALGFSTSAGPVDPVDPYGRAITVVGWVVAEPPLDFLNHALLTVADPRDHVVRIVVLSDSAEGLIQLTDAIGYVLGADAPTSVRIETSESLAEVRAAVQGELGTWGRSLVTLVLSAGLVLTAASVFGGVTSRRRDFGRRRALGASRLDIAVLVSAQTVLTAACGAALGVGVGALIVQQLLRTVPTWEFSLATFVLAVIAAGLASIPPALAAAYRDPVRILRVP